MENNEVIEGNKLIAEFMGGKWETIWSGGVEAKAFNFPGWHITDWPHSIHEDTFEYHTSWDWLMPVVEKIKDLTGNLGKAPNPQSLKVWMEMNKEYFKVTALPLATPINEVWESVINFIKWYKTTNLK